MSHPVCLLLQFEKFSAFYLIGSAAQTLPIAQIKKDRFLWLSVQDRFAPAPHRFICFLFCNEWPPTVPDQNTKSPNEITDVFCVGDMQTYLHVLYKKNIRPGKMRLRAHTVNKLCNSYEL